MRSNEKPVVRMRSNKKHVVRMKSNKKHVVRMKSNEKPVVRMRSTVSVSDQETRIRLLKYHLIHFNSKNSLKE